MRPTRGDAPQADRVEEGFAARRAGRQDEAGHLMVLAVEEARAAAGWRFLVRALKGSARIHRDRPELQVALEERAEAEKLSRQHEARLELAHTLRQNGEIHRREGRLDDAEAAYAEALSIGRSDAQTPKLELANTFRGVALLKEALGETNDAREAWQQALAFYLAADVPAGIEEARTQLATLTA